MNRVSDLYTCPDKMPSQNLLILFPLDDHLVERIRKDFGFDSVEYYPTTFVEGTKNPAARWFHEPPIVPNDVWAKTTVLMTMFFLPDSSSLTPHLRLIQVMSAGIEHIFPALQALQKGLPDLKVATSSGVSSTTIAEYVIMQSLNHFHKIEALRAIQESKKWARTKYVPPGKLGGCVELRDHTLGIVGYGCIGREVGRLGRAFGMNVIAATSAGVKCPSKGYTITSTGDLDGSIPSAWYRSAAGSADFNEFLDKCDVLVLCAPLIESTKHLINADALGKMRQKALLVNISRGGLVDQEALIDALEQGTIGGAVLDVTDPEPLPENHPMWSTKNITITPHIAGAGVMYAPRCVDLLEINVGKLRAGEVITNSIQLDKGY